jgi:hypothetical protein
MTQTQADQTDVRSIHDRAGMDHKQAYKNDTGTFERIESMDDRNRSTADDSSEARAND